MGAVFLAQGPNSKVALKFLNAGPDSETMLRFLREAQALAQVDKHPNIMTIHSINKELKNPYLVLEYIDGVCLEDWLKVQRASPERCLQICSEIASALAFIHDHGIIHRDLKPANIMICTDGRAVLTDFGLTRILDSETLTKTGDILGTPSHMSPEQISGQPLRPATDLWPLALVLYELCTAHRFYESLSHFQLLKYIDDGRVPKLLTQLHKCPKSWATLIVDCLKPLDQRQPQSALEFQRRLQSSEPQSFRPTAFGFGLLLTVAIATGLWFAWPKTEPKRSPVQRKQLQRLKRCLKTCQSRLPSKITSWLISHWRRDQASAQTARKRLLKELEPLRPFQSLKINDCPAPFRGSLAFLRDLQDGLLDQAGAQSQGFYQELIGCLQAVRMGRFEPESWRALKPEKEHGHWRTVVSTGLCLSELSLGKIAAAEAVLKDSATPGRELSDVLSVEKLSLLLTQPRAEDKIQEMAPIVSQLSQRKQAESYFQRVRQQLRAALEKLCQEKQGARAVDQFTSWQSVLKVYPKLVPKELPKQLHEAFAEVYLDRGLADRTDRMGLIQFTQSLEHYILAEQHAPTVRLPKRFPISVLWLIAQERRLKRHDTQSNIDIGLEFGLILARLGRYVGFPNRHELSGLWSVLADKVEQHPNDPALAFLFGLAMIPGKTAEETWQQQQAKYRRCAKALQSVLESPQVSDEIKALSRFEKVYKRVHEIEYLLPNRTEVMKSEADQLLTALKGVDLFHPNNFEVSKLRGRIERLRGQRRQEITHINEYGQRIHARYKLSSDNAKRRERLRRVFIPMLPEIYQEHLHSYYTERMTAYFATKQYSKALNDAQKLREWDPTSLGAWRITIRCHQAMEARAELQKLWNEKRQVLHEIGLLNLLKKALGQK